MVGRFCNRTEVEVIYSQDQQRRVVLFLRKDGIYGFLEEHRTDDEYFTHWVEHPHSTECFCDALETDRREAFSRVPWITSP